MENRKSIWALIISILIPLVVGFASSKISMPANSNDMMVVYEEMKQPKFAPPSSVFPIAWTILYVLMGVACYLLYASDSKYRELALIIYGIQLVFNFFWSIIFFKSSMYWVALVWLLIMWAMIIALIALSSKINLIAMVCLIPLALWCTFAAYLNFWVAKLN